MHDIITNEQYAQWRKEAAEREDFGAIIQRTDAARVVVLIDHIAALRKQLDPASNHYDRWWNKPERIDSEWLADTRRKMQEALTDPFCHDAADITLALIDMVERYR
jgi:hypothetical protein